ncbi:tRNA uridine(34) 5-carboxymethylaminomethyl modification radical SAM/GNAT enzyme Elp3, partial [Candidatus Wolfebacteria bacterium]|nr:tRNA uridine(34) 5-carboxymethylaminomethyl modification radical SAM/GNAT enzyme Elp3 [Candidatus Wolfebacteria bacterium]
RGAALIRELHTYGKLTPLGKKGKAAQHKNFGKKLVKLAEKIAAKEYSFKKIAAISGVGARNYWRKSGYKLKDTYMVKKIR